MQFFQSHGARIAFIDLPATGPDRGEPMVLVHGFASNHAVNWGNTLWTQALARDGRRVVALDNRGHGESQKFHDPKAYSLIDMGRDVLDLMDHLGIPHADVMGYSMGARITSFLAANHPGRLRSAIFGGLGMRLLMSDPNYLAIAAAMEAPSLDALTDPMQRTFRAFAEQTKSDLAALSACMRGTRELLTQDLAAAIRVPVLVAAGTKDLLARDYRELAQLIPGAELLEIPNRDHNLAVGDKVYKQGVLDYLRRRP
ncbi:Pimeloyl-ACP methyl ester carboxylesterase [Rhizobiales bacterium GAS191]|nr:Pimeloyl-ACP methyl ester carboxylesterase [Rhizobiales bacterium GAS113]SEE08494.1 Pimeloyl-ACP methyl ester carboxylesterase [Rhizobiales bacterium GAS191]